MRNRFSILKPLPLLKFSYAAQIRNSGRCSRFRSAQATLADNAYLTPGSQCRTGISRVPAKPSSSRYARGWKSDDARVLYAAALAHRGIIRQSVERCGDDLAAGHRFEVLPAYAAPTRETHLSGQRPPKPKLRLFIDRVVDASG